MLYYSHQIMENKESGGDQPQSESTHAAERKAFRKKTENLLARYSTRSHQPDEPVYPTSEGLSDEEFQLKRTDYLLVKYGTTKSHTDEPEQLPTTESRGKPNAELRPPYAKKR